ncbi:hypothetical protein ACOMHN_046492 [Nucella lapillus]
MEGKGRKDGMIIVLTKLLQTLTLGDLRLGSEDTKEKGQGRRNGQGQDREEEPETIGVTLTRDTAGSLGFNIMGGLTVEKNNNQSTTETEGIYISRIGEGGPADLKGLKLYDRVMKDPIKMSRAQRTTNGHRSVSSVPLTSKGSGHAA